MHDEFETRIDLYPSGLVIENVPAVFSLESEPADWGVGLAGGVWATLEYITLGGKALPREDVLLMIGCAALSRIETDISERLAVRVAAE